MPGFVPADPAEFFDPARMRIINAHHEAGHLLLAYYFGFAISRYAYRQFGRDLSAFVKNKMNPEFTQADAAFAAMAETQKLLAGELAGRINAGISAEQIVLPVKDFAAVSRDTPLRKLDWESDHKGHDTIRVLVIAHGLGVAEWWGWICEQHAEVANFLRVHWDKVERLAERILTVEPYSNDDERRAGTPSGHIEGDDLIRWCREIGCPVRDSRFTSVSYPAS